MLLFNQISICKNQKTTEISKHLMLLFNFCHIIYLYLLPSFQNISCYCLTCRGLTRYDKCKISKHLMLLFNSMFHLLSWLRLRISKHLMLLFNVELTRKQMYADLFQNISCYCLTPVAFRNTNDVKPFQNISCYCLTEQLSCHNYLFCPISKHLMLLFNQRKIIIFK